MAVRVRIDEESSFARWADWQSAIRGCPIGALGPDSARADLFVANEILVDPDDEGLARELAERYGLTLVEPRPMPPAPPGLAEVARVTDPVPEPTIMRFDREPPPMDDAGERISALLGDVPGFDGELVVTSRRAATVLALVMDLASQGRLVGLNAVGSSFALPGTQPVEWPQQKWTGSPAFHGRSNVAKAWQLIESYRLLASGAGTIFVAILDGGFWVDDHNVPFVPVGQPESDFGAGVLGINLIWPNRESDPVGGTNPSNCGLTIVNGLPMPALCPWHGNGTASIAVAKVGNAAGAAGSGGTVATPVFFKTSLAASQVIRCLAICSAWGIHVVNMSFGLTIKWGGEVTFPTSSWDKAFARATDNGVVMVAAAGNDGKQLPEHDVRPATRSRGVIAVGWLDENDRAHGDSNYGDSVNIWAPGSSLPVAPDGASNKNAPSAEAGSVFTGTSAAAPVVAGVAAMMRFVNSGLSSLDVRDILSRTGWQGPGRVTRGLDAYAAVLEAMGGALPRDSREPNDTPATASRIYPPPAASPQANATPGIVARSARGDVDWYQFTLDAFSAVTVTAEWYPKLSGFGLVLAPDDPDAISQLDPTWRTASDAGWSGVLAEGTYRLRALLGGDSSAYRLDVRADPAPLLPDGFEPNDSFDGATVLRFQQPKGIWSGGLGNAWGPGTFPLTLHLGTAHDAKAVNPDYFVFDVPRSWVFGIPTVTVRDTDAPVTIQLFGPDRQELQRWENVRSRDLTPPPLTTCYLAISGPRQTRYQLGISLAVDRKVLPGPLEEEVFHLPKWWGDPPPLRIDDRFRHYLVEVSPEDGPRILLDAEDGGNRFRAVLLDPNGEVVRVGDEIGPSGTGPVVVDTAGLPAGPYFLRLEGIDHGVTEAGAVEVKLLPPV